MALPKKPKTVTTKAKTKKEEVNKTEEVATAPSDKPARKTRSNMVNTGAFDIFSSQGLIEQTKTLLAKQSMAGGFKTADTINRDYLPVPWPAFSWLINRPGLPVNTVIEFIGQENVGKSSLVMALLGNFIKYNIPCLYMNSEPKMLDSDWISRLVGSDAALGERIKEVLEVDENVATLTNMDLRVRQWISIKRSMISKSIPLVIAIDSISKLLNPEEEEALLTAKMKAETLVKGVGDISNKPGVTAKWLHAWARGLKDLLEEQNVTIICVSGQNVKMDTGKGGMAPSPSLNKTRTGGTALDQSAALQITVTRLGMIRTTNNIIGEQITLKAVKNSYGPRYRSINYDLMNDDFKDTEGTFAQAIDMNSTFCNLLVDKKLLGLTCTAKRYSSDKLGLYSVKAESVMKHFANNPDLLFDTCQQLKISGYETIDS